MNASSTRIARIARFAQVALAALTAMAAPAHAEENSTQAAPFSASAQLDFSISIGRFLYLRVGNEGASVNTVGFSLRPSVDSIPIPSSSSNNTPLSWKGTEPRFVLSSFSSTIPVEIQANIGTVVLRSEVITPLSNGTHVISMREISTSSNDPAFPMPAMPGNIGNLVQVHGNLHGNLVIQRKASWSFVLTPKGYPAGRYTGQIRFSASSP